MPRMEGVTSRPSLLARFAFWVCRPSGLTEEKIMAVASYADSPALTES